MIKPAHISYRTPAFEVELEAGVVYAEKDGYWSQGSSAGPQLSQVALWRHPLELKMDIYMPADDDSEARPLLLMMHGGSFLFGNREEVGQVAWCRHFASLGYVAASIDYRLGFWPSKHGLLQAEADALDDADSALKFLLDRGDLRIDPKRVFAAGTSAGAILSMGLAYIFYGERPPKGAQSRLGPDFRICAVGDLWGYVRDLAILENARVPILAFQSEQDPVVPFDRGYPMNAKTFSDEVYGTRATCARAEELGIRCALHPCPEKRHRLHMDREGRLTPRYYEICDALVAFFAEAMEIQA
ncbi:MAG: alpha/beta hydrolase [Bacteroidales bacterium]|nr:alpha/beta hydrolase [Bacteroidales bacterium]